MNWYFNYISIRVGTNVQYKIVEGYVGKKNLIIFLYIFYYYIFIFMITKIFCMSLSFFFVVVIDLQKK